MYLEKKINKFTGGVPNELNTEYDQTSEKKKKKQL